MYEFFLSSLNDLRKLLLQNGYPVGIANYNMYVLRGQQQNAARPTTVPKKMIYIVLTYLGLKINVIARQLKCCISKFPVTSSLLQCLLSRIRTN